MKNLKKKLSPYFLLIFLAVFVIYFANNQDSFKPLLKVSALSLALIGLTKLAINLVNGLFTKWTVEVFTEKLRLAEATYIAILSAIGNFFGPLLGGATIRAVYLKRVHSLSYAKFTSTLAGYYVIVFIANSTLAIISLLYLNDSSYSSGLMTFFTIWLLALVVLMFFRLPAQRKVEKLGRNRILKFVSTVLYDIEKGWRSLIQTKGLVPKLCLLALAGFLITFVTAALEFNAINASISLAALGFYTAVSTSSMLISLTPGAIGIRESLLLLTSSVMGVSNAQILQVAVIDRGITFVMLGLLYVAIYFLKPRSMRELQDQT